MHSGAVAHTAAFSPGRTEGVRVKEGGFQELIPESRMTAGSRSRETDCDAASTASCAQDALQ